MTTVLDRYLITMKDRVDHIKLHAQDRSVILEDCNELTRHIEILQSAIVYRGVDMK